jgi:hypothetical protein
MRLALSLFLVAGIAGCPGKAPDDVTDQPDADTGDASTTALMLSGTVMDYFGGTPVQEAMVATDGLEPPQMATSSTLGAYAVEVAVGSKVFLVASKSMYRTTRNSAVDVADMPVTKDIYVMKELGILAAAGRGLSEVSRRVFAKGPEHNSDYLTDHTDGLCDVLGLGISSWNNLQGRFFVNTGESLEKYHSFIEQGRLPIAKGRIRSPDNEKRWAIAVPLKHHGVSKQAYRKIAGEELETSFGRKIEALKKFGLLEEDETSLRLTEKGSFLADEVVIQFYLPEYLPFPKASYSDGELNPYLP